VSNKFLVALLAIVTLSGCISSQEREEFESYKRQKKGFEVYQQSKQDSTTATANRTRPDSQIESSSHKSKASTPQQEDDNNLKQLLVSGKEGLNAITFQEYVMNTYGVQVDLAEIPEINCYLYVDGVHQFGYIDGECQNLEMLGEIESNPTNQQTNPQTKSDLAIDDLNNQPDDWAQKSGGIYQGSFGDYQQLSEQECFGTDSNGYHLSWLADGCVVFTPENEVLN
jgi:hypothetical protein